MAEEETSKVSTLFSDNYELHDELGRGAFSVVRKCVQKVNGLEFAAKIIIIWDMTDWDYIRLAREIRICRKLTHPNIIGLCDSIREMYHHYLVFELLTGGELLDDIILRNHYSEADASSFIQQILEGVKYLHGIGIVHRDLKPQNLLLSDSTERKNVKLIDFGLAIEIEGDGWYGFAGTSAYISPEMLNNKPYGKAVDVWACGVILYILLIGYPPFWHYDINKLYEEIKSGEYHIESKQWLSLTLDARHIIDRMLTVNPGQRITAAEALQHPWVCQRHDTAANEHRRTTITYLKLFKARCKLMAAILTTVAVRRFSRKQIRIKGNFSRSISTFEVSETSEPQEEAMLSSFEKEVEEDTGGQKTKEVEVQTPNEDLRPFYQRMLDLCVVL